jgi:hypothetical protein
MWLTVSLVVYAVGWYRTALLVTRRENEKDERHYFGNSQIDREMNLVWGMIVALAWPAYLPIDALHRRMLNDVGPTRREMQRENERLQADIARLEREAGLS